MMCFQSIDSGSVKCINFLGLRMAHINDGEGKIIITGSINITFISFTALKTSNRTVGCCKLKLAIAKFKAILGFHSREKAGIKMETF